MSYPARAEGLVNRIVCIYWPRTSRMWHKVSFYVGFIRLDFRGFLLLDQLLTKAEEPSLSYYFTHNWRENSWIHTFPKDISFPSPRPVAIPKLKSLIFPTILPITGGRIVGFLPFQRILVFLLLDRLPYQSKDPSLPYYFTHNWRENSWILTFPKDISFPSPRSVAIPKQRS